jgi:hypothetical protein
MRKQYKNSKKESFLESIPIISLDNDLDELTIRCKFNFSYFDASQGQDFSDWDANELLKLLNKLKEYSKQSLQYWEAQRAGKYSIFVKYEAFPSNSNFYHPKHIPHQIIWARFHLENKPRLIGFVVPAEYEDTIHKITGKRFDSNTFYIVFLDRDHEFYKTS